MTTSILATLMALATIAESITGRKPHMSLQPAELDMPSPRLQHRAFRGSYTTIRAILERSSIIARMIPRRLLPTLTAALAEAPTVALLGPRQAGKTAFALEVAKVRPSFYRRKGRAPG